jgi:hypothetical protein
LLTVVFSDGNIFTSVRFKGLQESYFVKKKKSTRPPSLNDGAKAFLKPSVKMLPNFKALLFAKFHPLISL